ncbi:type IV toxin-antitoxin system AbiEi family antitoxin domain-containing protein [Microbacterium sp. CBA3102]|nr:type IV toxin-antitoxin system AbiEi family antitoxin domain-containing protein [Microbacterium sp. CBA3102]
MLDPTVLLARLGGLARGVELQRCGMSRPELAKAVREKRIDRVRPGVFASPALNSHLRRAALHGGALTCGAALRLHGVWVLCDDSPLHVWVGRRGRVNPHVGCQCVTHYFRGTPGLGLVDVETALIHFHRCRGDEAFFAAFESAWKNRLLSSAARMRIRKALPAYARWLVDIGRSDADSGLESLVRLRLHMLGILVECQVLISGVGRVDFIIDGRLILEIDGRRNHDGASHRHKDLARDAAASARGMETLRFDFAQVVYDWSAVQTAIIAALARCREHA